MEDREEGDRPGRTVAHSTIPCPGVAPTPAATTTPPRRLTPVLPPRATLSARRSVCDFGVRVPGALVRLEGLGVADPSQRERASALGTAESRAA